LFGALRVGRDAASVAHDLGAVLYVPAAMAAASLPVAFMVGDRHALLPLAAVAVVAGATGGILAYRYRHVRAEHRWPAVEVAALGWLVTVLAAALVLFLLGRLAPSGAADVAFADPLNALFEGASGVTSTGLSVVAGDEPALTRTAQWWRTLAQWVGGVGMVLFAVGLTHPATGMRNLYDAEGHNDELPGGTSGTLKRISLLYVALTAASIGALALTEHDPWTALNHGITGISTGGFNVTGDSLASFGTGTKLVALAIIVAGSVSFVAHHVLLVQRDPRRLWRMTPVRAQAAVLVGGAALFALAGGLVGSDVDVTDRVFQWASASGTAGFATVTDLAGWSASGLGLLVVVMVVGAPSGSTGGGVKVDRVAWLGKSLVRRLRGAATITWGGRVQAPGRSHEFLRRAGILVAAWVATLLLGTLVVASRTGAPILSVVFEVASALSNVGLSTDVVGADLDGATKIVFAVLMYLGRLELLAALVLATQQERA
jgi:trk system potassium uptake protein